MPKARLLVVASVVLLAAGCSAGSSTPTPSPIPSVVPSTPAVASSAPPSAAPCPDGAYLVTAFEGRGESSGAGKGSGGDVEADFTAGTFTISSDGSDPTKLDLGAVDAQLRFTGKITGTYEGDAAALRLTATGADGNVVIKGLGFSRDYPASSLGDQLVGSGATAQVTCDDAAGTAVVVLPNASLTLTRKG